MFKKVFFKQKDVPFVMEIPPYRIPTLKNTLIHMWEKSKQYLYKMGSVILVASVVIWLLTYLPRNIDYSKDYEALIENVENNVTNELEKKNLVKAIEIEKESEHIEKSYIGQIGRFIEPVMSPLGFDWKIGVSLVGGLAVKEIIVSTMGVLYQVAEDDEVGLQNKLQQTTYNSGSKKGEKVFNSLIAVTLMVFILIYFPCIAAIAAIRKEAGTKWAVFVIFYTTILAWIVSFLVKTTGSFFI
jgi:ferrous iron transport protein B